MKYKYKQGRKKYLQLTHNVTANIEVNEFQRKTNSFTNLWNKCTYLIFYSDNDQIKMTLDQLGIISTSL